MTQCPLRNHMPGRSLATYFTMESGSGQTPHMHLHHGALCYKSCEAIRQSSEVDITMFRYPVYIHNVNKTKLPPEVDITTFRYHPSGLGT